MAKIIFISGPCGCGKTTLTNAFVRPMVNRDHKTMYVIHGDDFQKGFKEPDDKGAFFVDGQASDTVHWEDILRFNWDCMMHTAERALADGLDVVIDYIIETEMPRVKDLAEKTGSDLYYIVLTATEEELVRRIRYRGDTDLVERAKFLKRELDAMPENQGHLLDNTGLMAEEIIESIDLDKFRV